MENVPFLAVRLAESTKFRFSESLLSQLLMGNIQRKYDKQVSSSFRFAAPDSD